MTLVRFLPLAFIAGPLVAQSADNVVQDPSPVIQHAIQGIGRAALGLGKIPNSSWFQAPRVAPAPVVAVKPPREPACAIPLLEAPIPDQSNFPIRRVDPPVTENMKTTRGLPPCEPR